MHVRGCAGRSHRHRTLQGWTGTNGIAACTLLEQAAKKHGDGTGGFGEEDDAWGAPFLLAATLICVAYVGGGLGFAVRQQGAPLAVHSHPHYDRWSALRGLVADGITFSRKRLQEQQASGSAAGYQQVGEPVAPPPRDDPPE